MAPLPPRPNKPAQIENENEQETEEVEVKSNPRLTEHTQAEQKAGQESLKLSKSKFNEEQEAGRKLVEYNRQKSGRKA